MSETNEQNISPRETVTGTFTRLAPWTLGARFIVMIMSVVAISIITRTLDKAQLDEYTLLKVMWNYIWLLGQMGLSEVTLRFGAELSARGNTRGFKKLLGRVILLQSFAIIAMLVSFILLRGWLDTLFSVKFGFALLMTVILGGITIFKESLRQGYVAAYWVKLVALMSVIGAVAFPVASYIYIVVFGWGVSGGLAAEATGYALMILVFVAAMPRLKFRRSVPKDSEEEPVTKYRIFRYSGAVFSNNLMTLAFGWQVVTLLIGYFLRSQKGAVGIYYVASFLPSMAMSFLTLSIIPLIMAMLTKAYYENKTRLPELLRSYHKLMVVLIMPGVMFGMIFLDKILETLSGEIGVDAGGIALMLLPAQMILIFVMPLSAGLNIVEKAQRLIVANIILGSIGTGATALALYLWPDLHSVVAATYFRRLVLAPIQMFLIVRFLGGFYFPFRFFCRGFFTCLPLVLLVPLRFLWPNIRYWAEVNLGSAIIGSIGILAIALILSAVILAASSRLFRLFGPEEIKYFRNARFPGVNLAMKILVQKRYR